jgi:hypothetical protein
MAVEKNDNEEEITDKSKSLESVVGSPPKKMLDLNASSKSLNGNETRSKYYADFLEIFRMPQEKLIAGSPFFLLFVN